MLTALRSAAGSWVAKLLLVLLVLSFAVWGISGQIFGGLGSNVVVVGDTRVSVLEYRLAYDRQVSLLSQQFGQPVTREQAQAFGVDDQVLAQLIAGAVLDEQAREMRLGLSRDRLASLTGEDPAFQGANGQFDRAQFEWVLRQIGMTPQDYLKNREQVAVRQQIVEAVSDGIVAPDTFLRAMSLYQNEDRTVEYVVLSPALVDSIEAPTDQQVQEWFDANKPNYTAPEYRRIIYAKLEPEDIADPAAVTDDEARATYDRTIDRFTTAERRRIEQLVFANDAEANAALEKIRGGMSFDDIIVEQGKTANDVLLGTFEKDRVADPAIAEAAFSLEQGQVSDVIPGTFGQILLRVTAIEPESVQSYEAVNQQIREEIALDEAHRIITEVYDGYEDSRAAGDSLVEAASKQKLQVTTVEAIDRSGKNPEGTTLTDLPISSTLLAEAFEAEIGVENPPLNIGSTGYVFFEVEDVTASRERTLDEVREQVVADWTSNERTTRLTARAGELQKEVNDGKPFADVASSIEMDLQTRRGLKRGANDADFGTTGVAAAFGVARGQTGLVQAPDGESQILFRVAEVIQPLDAGPESVPEDIRQQFATGVGNDLLDQMVAMLQSHYSISIDRNAVAQALSF